MAEFKELIEKFKAIRDALPEVLPDVATSMSLTAKAIAERTIKDKGFGELYSDTEVPAWFFKGKELNKRGANYILTLENEATDDEPAKTNWGEFRQAQGLQSKYVDLSYSNKMWAGMYPQDVMINLFTYVAPLGANNTEAQNKMNWNYDCYGDFLGKALTGDGEDALYKVAFDELVRLLDEKLK